MSQVSNLSAIVVILVLAAAVIWVIKHSKVWPSGNDIHYSYSVGDKLKEIPE